MRGDVKNGDMVPGRHPGMGPSVWERLGPLTPGFLLYDGAGEAAVQYQKLCEGSHGLSTLGTCR